VGRLKAIAKRALRASRIVDLALYWRRGNPLILMYHGVTRTPPRGLSNVEGKHVGLDRFVEQLRFLKRHRRFLPLDELVDGVLAGADMSNAVAITFDDGYENNLTQAAPALADLGLPATFFLATGYLDVVRWMWVDRLEAALDRSPRAEIQVDGVGRVSLADKRGALRTIKGYAKAQPEAFVTGMVATVEEQCGGPLGAPEGDYRFMTWAQAAALKAAGFAVGAHSVNHPILSRVDPETGEREMVDSRNAIRERLGTCSSVFCYPNGKSSDYTPAIMASAAKHFRAALATNRGPARASERYELRRIGIDHATTADSLAAVLLGER
jgi:peptidoglycan/xylan/chitin deacetylase (PgdA/CDA1 family)